MDLKTGAVLSGVMGVGFLIGSISMQSVAQEQDAPGVAKQSSPVLVPADPLSRVDVRMDQVDGPRLKQQADMAFSGQLAPAAPKGLRDVVWDRAMKAYECAKQKGKIQAGAAVAIIDYDLPSSKKRLWLVDPDNPKKVVHEWVAHGSGSGNLVAEAFSNTVNSYQTSLGVFRGAEVYEGKYGKSLRLDGLEPGFNDAARERAIVVHPAWYAEPDMIAKTGRLGRSQGCPAVREAVMPQVREALAEGGMLFAHASDEDWINGSGFLNCG